MIDGFITCIRQVAALLGYREPQIMEVLRTTLPRRLYWVLFLIEDLREAIETAKRILTVEKIDRELAGQSNSTPFLSIYEGYSNNKRTVPFDTQVMLETQIENLPP